MKNYQPGESGRMASVVIENITGVLASGNVTTSSNSTPPLQPEYNRNVRLATYVVIFVVSMIGNTIVCTWMWTHRKHKSRMNKLILSLTLADLFVTLCPLVTEFVQEILLRKWVAGNTDPLCRLLMVLQVFAIHASSNMVVVISIDRHRALRNPFARNIPSKFLISGAWVVALLLALPQGFVWYLTYGNGQPYCVTIFKGRPAWHVKMYVTYASVVAFLIPFCIICVLYLQILKTVWERGKEINLDGKLKKAPSSKQMNAIISRAKIKTLKMTLVIILTFIICGMPYFVMEMVRLATGKVEPTAYAVLGIFALSNSAANPFVFLFFNSDNKFFAFLEQRFCFTCFKTQEDEDRQTRFVSTYTVKNGNERSLILTERERLST
ncbi:arg8-vasotocin receptor-like [Ptychodera flava]|uniref:arg8-vasotocin receptor-like n=1 Tax=Ptychodera flava TaxID=63121 RepID=UPI00396A54C7